MKAVHKAAREPSRRRRAPAKPVRQLAPYRLSSAGALLAAREALMTPIRPILRAAGVTEQQWRVLRVLADEGPVDISSLASSALLIPSSVSRILRELTARGLIARSTDGADRRRFIVEITGDGRELLNSTAARTLEIIDRYLTAFGEARHQAMLEEIRTFTATVTALFGGIEGEGD